MSQSDVCDHRLLLRASPEYTVANGYPVDFANPLLLLSDVGNMEYNEPCRICIEDAGRGIDAEQLERIFDCFYQVESYLQRTIGGMGIGLTICRYLIQGMGGQIWAESAGARQGSRVCFTLPVPSGVKKSL